MNIKFFDINIFIAVLVAVMMGAAMFGSSMDGKWNFPLSEEEYSTKYKDTSKVNYYLGYAYFIASSDYYNISSGEKYIFNTVDRTIFRFLFFLLVPVIWITSSYLASRLLKMKKYTLFLPISLIAIVFPLYSIYFLLRTVVIILF